MDKKIAALKDSVDLTRTWIVVDMDAFYAAVEELYDPSLVRLKFTRHSNLWYECFL